MNSITLNKTIFSVVSLGLLLLNFSCKSASIEDNSKDLAALEQTLQSKKFRVNMIAAYPFNTAATNAVLNSVLVNNQGDNASRIDLNGEGYYVEFSDSLTTADLPYFGEQRLATTRYGGDDGGIKFNAEAKNYTIKKHKRKAAFIVKFEIKDDIDNSESYDITLTAYPNGTANMVIVSSHRTGINYKGNLVTVE